MVYVKMVNGHNVKNDHSHHNHQMTTMTRKNTRTTKKTTTTDCTHLFKHGFFPFTFLIFPPLVSSRLILVLIAKQKLSVNRSDVHVFLSIRPPTCHMQKGLFNLITHLLLLRFLTQQIKYRACRNKNK